MRHVFPLKPYLISIIFVGGNMYTDGPPPQYLDRYSDDGPVNQEPLFDDRTNVGMNMAPPPQDAYSDGRRTPSDIGKFVLYSKIRPAW